MWALINSRSKINAMTPVYVLELGLKVRQTNVGDEKNDGSMFKIFEIVLASFQIEDKFKRTWFFSEIFLLADTSVKMILEIPFLILSNLDI